MPNQDADIIRKNLAIARDFPDEYIVSYTRETLKGELGEWQIQERVPINLAIQPFHLRFTPARKLQVRKFPNPEYLERVGQVKRKQIISFLISRAIIKTIRFCKILASALAFVFTISAFTMFWIGWRTAEHTLDRRVFPLLAAGIITGLGTLILHIRQTRTEPKFEPNLDTPEICAFKLARKSKNTCFTFSLVLACICLGVVSSFHSIYFSGAQTIMTCFALLVLSLEAAVIGLYFDLKQQSVIKLMSVEIDIRVKPFLYQYEEIANAAA